MRYLLVRIYLALTNRMAEKHMTPDQMKIRKALRRRVADR